MSKGNYYKRGSYNAVCDVCGFRFKAEELDARWDGVMACKKDWEPRNSLDFIKAPKGTTALSWTRPEPDNNFITVNYVSSSTGTQDLTIPSGTFTSNNSTT